MYKYMVHAVQNIYDRVQLLVVRDTQVQLCQLDGYRKTVISFDDVPH